MIFPGRRRPGLFAPLVYRMGLAHQVIERVANAPQFKRDVFVGQLNFDYPKCIQADRTGARRADLGRSAVKPPYQLKYIHNF